MKTGQPYHVILGILSLIFWVYTAKTIQLLTGVAIVPFFGFGFGSSIILYSLYIACRMVENASLCPVRLKQRVFLIHSDDLPAFYALVRGLLSKGYTLKKIERFLALIVVAATLTTTN